MQWQRIDKPDFGYAVHLPGDLIEQPLNVKNSPWETARFTQPGDRRHSVIVFRGPTRPGHDLAELADGVRISLGHAGFTDFESTDVPFAGRDGVRVDCARYDAGRVWAVREYFVVEEDVYFRLACGSAVPDEDDGLFTAMADRFEIFDVR